MLSYSSITPQDFPGSMIAGVEHPRAAVPPNEFISLSLLFMTNLSGI
jgi:hypothetical protein